MKKIDFDKLILWQSSEEKSFAPGLPSLSRRPNPLLVGDLVIVNSFKSKAVIALEKQNGQLVWKHELGEYGGYSPSSNKRRVYVSTVSRVLCLEPKEGRKIWSYEPYSQEEASFYSDVVLVDDRVLISDRYGYLHCLDAESGKIIWKTFLSTKGPFALNATVVVVDNKAYAITTGGELSCVDVVNGTTLWAMYLDEGAIRPPIVWKKKVYFHGKTSVFIVDPTALHRVKKVRFEEILDICVCDSGIYVLEHRAVEGSAEESRILSLGPNGKVRFIGKMRSDMTDLIQIVGDQYLAILGAERIVFFNKVTGKFEMQIVGSLFSSVPFISKDCIYTVGILNEAVCLMNPIRK